MHLLVCTGVASRASCMCSRLSASEYLMKSARSLSEAGRVMMHRSLKMAAPHSGVLRLFSMLYSACSALGRNRDHFKLMCLGLTLLNLFCKPFSTFSAYPSLLQIAGIPKLRQRVWLIP